MHRVAHKLRVVLGGTAEDLHVSHNVFLLHRQRWRLLAKVIHVAGLDQADVFAGQIVDHLLPAVVARLMKRAVEGVLGASFQFRIVYVVILGRVPFPSNTVRSRFHRKRWWFVVQVVPEDFVVRLNTTVLYHFGQASLLHSTGGHLGGCRQHHVATFSAGLRHEGIDLLVLLLLLLLLSRDHRNDLTTTTSHRHGIHDRF